MQTQHVSDAGSKGKHEGGGSKPASFPTKLNHPIMRLQKAIGNQAVQRLIAREPDGAETMRGYDGDVSRGASIRDVVSGGIQSPGHPLDFETRRFMEERFGYDFSQVRTHSDSAAAESSHSIAAHAYTLGQDIVFAEGKYSPGSSEGRRLLAHELTHVVQQESGPVAGTPTADGSLSISDPEDTFERAADAQAEQIIEGATAGEAMQSAGEATPAGSVQREEDPQQSVAGKVLSNVATAGGVGHAGIEFVEGAEATTQTIEAAEGVAKSMQGFEDIIGPLPAGIAAAAEGSPEFMYTARAAQFAQGAGGTGGASLGNAVAPLALGAGIYEDYKAIKDMKEHGANLENTPDLVQGALETTSGGIGTLGLAGAGLSGLGATGAGGTAIGAAAAAAPIGMVAGAGALGMLAGKGMAEMADSSYTKTGAFGTDADTGKNRSAMDWGANWGTSWDKAHNNSEASITGGILAATGGVVGGISGAAYGAGNWLADKL